MSDYAAFAEAERRGWSDPGRVAAYTALFAAASDQLVPAIVAASGAGPGRRVLDLCCGQGNVTAALVAAGAEVTGLDFSPAMLALARTRAPAARLVEGDAGELPFADASFDAVACNVGIGHVPDQPRAVAEIARVLRPGGVAALSSWSEPERSPTYQLVFDAIRSQPGADLSLAPPAPDFHMLARAETAEALLAGAGFGDIRLAPVEVAWEFDRPDAFAEVIARATVRAAMLIAAQPPAVRAAIPEAMTAAVAARFAAGPGRWRVPFPAVIATAIRV